MGAINAVTDLTVQGDVAVLTLNSPPVNALSQQVRDGIVEACSRRSPMPPSRPSY